MMNDEAGVGVEFVTAKVGDAGFKAGLDLLGRPFHLIWVHEARARAAQELDRVAAAGRVEDRSARVFSEGIGHIAIVFSALERDKAPRSDDGRLVFDHFLGHLVCSLKRLGCQRSSGAAHRPVSRRQAYSRMRRAKTTGPSCAST